MLSDLLVKSLKLALVSDSLNNSLSVSSGDGNSSWLDNNEVGDLSSFLSFSALQFLDERLLEDDDLVNNGGGELLLFVRWGESVSVG